MRRIIIPDEINYCFASADLGFDNNIDAIKFSRFLIENKVPYSICYKENLVIFNIEGTIRPCTMDRFYGEEEAKGFDFLVIEC